MNTGVRADVIKVGSTKGQISDYEKLMFVAATMVHKATGVPINADYSADRQKVCSSGQPSDMVKEMK